MVAKVDAGGAGDKISAFPADLQAECIHGTPLAPRSTGENAR